MTLLPCLCFVRNQFTVSLLIPEFNTMIDAFICKYDVHLFMGFAA